ncbi:MAG: hypothetical protein D6675_06690 [Gemmatimonadetes bacterium]|nr:MAG: hypothetical protein D6675_06690 [Gemmatimonadota bacterium]
MILIEGNIGAGKTTVGHRLRESGKFGFIEEPVEKWKTGFASNLLNDFYHDMTRWSFTFQIMAFTTRAKTWKEILEMTDHRLVLLERSIFTDRYVFAQNLHQSGFMTDAEWEVYVGLWEFLASNYCVEPDCILYLRTPAELCLERIHQRARGEESEIPLDYLLHLESLHDNWLLEHPNAVILDGTQEFSVEDVVDAIAHIIDI